MEGKGLLTYQSQSNRNHRATSSSSLIMTGITKRQVQSGRKDAEGGSGTSKTYGQSTEEMQMKLRRHFNDTYNMNHQWRVSEAEDTLIVI